MDPALRQDVITTALCLLGSGFFSASETALTSLPITRLEALRTTTGRLTRAGLDRWATAPQALLITILIGNNLVNVVASALASRITLRLTGEGGLAVAVGLVTLAILVVGEITPKTLAQQHSEWISSRVAGPLYLLDLALRPIGAVLGLLTRMLSGKNRPDAAVTEQDLLFMLRLAHRHAQLPPDARHMIENVLRFQQAVAREAMVPRPQVHFVDRSWPLERVLDEIGTAGHSRFPVIDGSPDEIIGILHTKSLLQIEDPLLWADLVVPALFIPETRALPDLLRELRTSGRHMAIVLDEYGGVSGLVTIEDVLEEIVGEIIDEYDDEVVAEIESIDAETWEALGRAHIDLINETMDLDLPEDDDFDTIAGFVFTQLGHIPAPGETVVWRDKVRITVLEASRRRIERVRLERIDRKARETA